MRNDIISENINEYKKLKGRNMAKEISMSKSQSNGITGEMLLPLHLKDKFNCIANKPDYDFGFDYDVHVFNSAKTTTGIFFKAQCKEVESGEYKYAKLEDICKQFKTIKESIMTLASLIKNVKQFKLINELIYKNNNCIDNIKIIVK